MDLRLSRTAYDASGCSAATKGEILPRHMGNDIARLCTLRGIRHHPQFAFSPEVTELALRPDQRIFARARNARLIMSGQVPSAEEMPDSDSVPYCIWYPDVASEAACRTLVAAHPEFRYQVGRVCAIGGYTKLYHDLNLLPDTSIAEEARENHNVPQSRDIFDSIMAAPARYRVMDDYSRTVELDNPRPGAYLNADTAVRATLERCRGQRQRFRPWNRFNITEDWNIAEHSYSTKAHELTKDEETLLYSPLPVDLPTMHKDLMILMAAHTGNVDRYARLRRPRRMPKELNCLVRGIYFSTNMALWLHRSVEVVESLKLPEDQLKILRRAINARLAMNDAVGHLLDGHTVPDDELPYWLWHPTSPAHETLIILAKARPTMRPQCARACIAIGYYDAYCQIMDMPDPRTPESSLAVDILMLNQARWGKSEGNAFETDLLTRQAAQGDLGVHTCRHYEWQKFNPWSEGDEPVGELIGSLQDTSRVMLTKWSDGMYEDLCITGERVWRYLCSTEDDRALARAEEEGFLDSWTVLSHYIEMYNL